MHPTNAMAASFTIHCSSSGCSSLLVLLLLIVYSFLFLSQLHAYGSQRKVGTQAVVLLVAARKGNMAIFMLATQKGMEVQ